MASVQQGEKQLFEKFWRGTFKAVATPRPGSIIVASITSRKPLPSSEVPSCSSLSTADKHSEQSQPAQETSMTNGCVRLRDRQQSGRQKSHSPSCDEDFTPPPARAKKKKKKSTRKKRRRSPSCSLSPVKKKKKKKNSKKRKKNRLSSKKRRHSSSSPKSKRKEERKHKKHSRSQPRKSQRRHHHQQCRSGSDSANSLSKSCGSRPRARSQEEGRRAKWKRSQHSSTCARKPDGAPVVTDALLLGHALQKHRHLSATGVISKSGSFADPFQKAEGQLGQLAKRHGEPPEYDSGNDTSSPPSTQTTSSRSKGSREASGPVRNGLDCHWPSGKVSSGSSSDSGNSFTSCISRNKGTSLEDPTPSRCTGAKEQSSPIRPCFWNESSASRSTPESGRSRMSCHKAGLRSSQSRSCSSGTRSYSRSPSYSSGRKSSGSRSSRSRRSPSYSRYSPGRDREQDHKYSSSGKESHRHRDRRRRKQSYSPMRKRRRDSPSHLEARRITSARKRPIPYYRPSPSSSSSSSVSSYSSWYSSRSRGRSYSSHRTSCSRSSSRSRNSDARSSRRSCSRSSESTGSYDSPRH